MITVSEDKNAPSAYLTLADMQPGRQYLIVEGPMKGRIIFNFYAALNIRALNQGEWCAAIGVDSAMGIWFKEDYAEDDYHNLRLREVNVEMKYSFVSRTY